MLTRALNLSAIALLSSQTSDGSLSREEVGYNERGGVLVVFRSARSAWKPWWMRRTPTTDLVVDCSGDQKESHRERARADLGTYTAAALRAGSLLLSLVLIEQGIAGDSACRAITCGGQSAMVG